LSQSFIIQMKMA